MNSLQAKPGSLSDQLEKLIDKNSLTDVLESIARICDAKHIHIQDNWQDNGLSQKWLASARRVETAVKCVSKYGV